MRLLFQRHDHVGGTVSIWTGKAELGQGIRTAPAQIAAEELDVAFERIRIEAVDTARSPSEGRTTGSVSIERSGAAIRIANAVADATGARIRDLPLIPERVSASLASAAAVTPRRANPVRRA